MIVLRGFTISGSLDGPGGVTVLSLFAGGAAYLGAIALSLAAVSGDMARGAAGRGTGAAGVDCVVTAASVLASAASPVADKPVARTSRDARRTRLMGHL
jgi:hypothetical protein